MKASGQPFPALGATQTATVQPSHLDAEDGVIRVSLLHYNTEEEVRGFVKILDEVVSGD